MSTAFNVRTCFGWALLITGLSFAAYGIASNLQPLYLQWGEICKTDLPQSDYIVNFTRNEGSLGCLWFVALGDAPQRPAFVFVAALATRFALLATALMFIVTLFQSRAAAVLATTWLVVKFGLWQAISSLNVVEQPAFGPRGIAGVQILLGLLLATRNRPVLAAIALGSGFYTQILNAGLTALVVIVFLALNVAIQPERRQALVALGSFVGTVVLFGVPYVFTTGSAFLANVSLKEWTAMRFLVEPDDTSLIYTFGWVGPEWYALHALGLLSLGVIVGKRPRAWLEHAATRWLIAVWAIVVAAAACEFFYERLPDFPFVWVLQFQFRRIVWLSGFLMVAAIAAALVKCAGAPSPLVRRLGQTGVCVALALPLIRLYPSALGILLALTLPAAALSLVVRGERRQLIACFVLATALLSVPHLSLQLAEAWGMQQGAVGRLARTVDRAGVDLVGTVLLALFVALAPILARALAARRGAWKTLALAAYIVWFFGWPGVTTTAGLANAGEYLKGFASVVPLPIAGWREFARDHDPLIRSLMATGEYEPVARRHAEEAARAAAQLTPATAIILVPLDSSQMRGMTGRSILLLEDEDSDASTYSPLLWEEFRTRFRDVTGWDYLEYKRRESAGAELPTLRSLYLALTPEQIRSLAARYGVTHVITEAGQSLPFAVVYRNEGFVLYQIGTP